MIIRSSYRNLHQKLYNETILLNIHGDVENPNGVPANEQSPKWVCDVGNHCREKSSLIKVSTSRILGADPDSRYPYIALAIIIKEVVSSALRSGFR